MLYRQRLKASGVFAFREKLCWLVDVIHGEHDLRFFWFDHQCAILVFQRPVELHAVEPAESDKVIEKEQLRADWMVVWLCLDRICRLNSAKRPWTAMQCLRNLLADRIALRILFNGDALRQCNIKANHAVKVNLRRCNVFFIVFNDAFPLHADCRVVHAR